MCSVRHKRTNGKQSDQYHPIPERNHHLLSLFPLVILHPNHHLDNLRTSHDAVPHIPIAEVEPALLGDLALLIQIPHSLIHFLSLFLFFYSSKSFRSVNTVQMFFRSQQSGSPLRRSQSQIAQRLQERNSQLPKACQEN